MKFRVDRDVLANAVSWTARTLPNRPAIPVLAGIRIEASEEGSLDLTTFDYEVSARSQISAEVETPGVILVFGRLLTEISKSLPNRPVEFSYDGSKVNVTCGSSRFTLGAMQVEDYPSLPEMPEQAGTIDVDDFSKAVSQVTVAAGRDESLPLLTGVKIEIRGEQLTLLATDRYRLALREISWQPSSPSMERETLVRARVLTDVARSLHSGGRLELSLSQNSDIIGFESEGSRTTSTMIDGDYPPVRRLFPDQTPTHAVVNTAAMVDAVKRVSLVAERNTPIRLSFTEGQVVLEAGQGEEAQASEALESLLVGEDIETAFNPSYLLDGLGAIETDFIRFSFTHGSKPVLFTGQDSLETDDHDTDFKYLLVPIRFSS
ncbi:MAG TPA: DNA polymerase III subunit beta [Beutenbergiaceae bacterium]|nr:DNA polymerase III subunit beta [Beutenbergiaceae bacterium]